MKQAYAVLLGTAILWSVAAAGEQFATVGVDLVKEAAVGKGKALLVDVRSPEEYLAGHIPGAVNIPAERVAAERGRLPKDKAAAIIFYCRGVG